MLFGVTNFGNPKRKYLLNNISVLFLQTRRFQGNIEIEIHPNDAVQQILLDNAKIQLDTASSSLDAAAVTFESMVSTLRDQVTLVEIFDPMIAPLERVKYAAKELAWSVRRILDQITEATKS